MTILLCDDHVMFLEALRTVLEREGYPVETTTRPDAAVDRVRNGGPVDVVVMDLSFPDASGVDGVARVLEHDPDACVVLLTASVDQDALRLARDAGAATVADKAQPLSVTTRLIGRLASDGSASVSGDIPAPRAPQRGAQAFLTRREREVLQRLVRGEGTQDIADELGVAFATARTHIQNVLDKLGVHSRLEAVALAVRSHLVTV